MPYFDGFHKKSHNNDKMYNVRYIMKIIISESIQYVTMCIQIVLMIHTKNKNNRNTMHQLLFTDFSSYILYVQFEIR